jgi:SAM-dependent methyltransferase
MGGHSLRTPDYSKIADGFDAARSMRKRNMGKWLGLISKRVGRRSNISFLDLGCGTGRFSIPIALKLYYSVTGADSSDAMLAIARSKAHSSLVKWDNESAESLSYGDCSFDAVFTSHLLHHSKAPLEVLGECYRVLKGGGIYLNRYGAMEHVETDPEHRFFPGLIGIDRMRTPTIPQVEGWLKAVGFIDIHSITLEQQTHSSGNERLEKVRLKPSSALNLLTRDSFEAGLKALGEFVVLHPNAPWLRVDKITLTTGKK